MNQHKNHQPPVIILGGGANALSVARSLGSRGVKVYAIGENDEHIRYSRFSQWLDVPINGTSEESWTRFLCGAASDHLRGAILLTGCDSGLMLIAHNRAALSEKFVLDESNPQAQLCMLNKLQTYQQAVAAGVPTPRFWVTENRAQVLAAREELVFPLIVKPLLSHVFENRFAKKFEVAHDFDELLTAYAQVEEAGIAAMLVELIPGGDDRLCSYYTYLDESGNALFDFTKRIIRRFPAGMGPACYHITDRNPAVREEALKLFRFVGLRGLANAEFKRDDRDGKLKLIECNARFTAANCLVAASGYDLASFVYNRLTGQRQKPLRRYKSGLRLWSPERDYHAFRQLQKRGELSWAGWIRSLAHRQTFAYFQWNDPMPSLVTGWRGIQKGLMRRANRVAQPRALAAKNEAEAA